VDNHGNSRAEVYSTKIRAGKRTYFFDVKETRSNDYYITITESKRRFSGDGYEKHKIFLYKEDFNKFMGRLTETIDYVKTTLLPDYDYDEFDRNDDYDDDDYEDDDDIDRGPSRFQGGEQGGGGRIAAERPRRYGGNEGPDHSPRNIGKSWDD
jgi:Protein of unknown function (DUF3276)